MLTYSLLRRASVRPLFHADRARAQSRFRRHAHRQSGAWRFPDARRVPGVLAVHAVRASIRSRRSSSRSSVFVLVGLAALLPAGAAAAARARPGNAVVHPVLRPVAGDRGGHHHRFRHQRALDPGRSARPRHRPVESLFAGHAVESGPVEIFGQTFPASWVAAASPAAAPCCSSIFISTARGSAI